MMTSFLARSCVFLLFALCFFADDRRVPLLSSLGGGLLLAEACDPGKAGAQHEHECPPQEQLNQFIASLVPAYEKQEFWNFDHPKPVLGHRALNKFFTFDGAERTSYQEIVDYARHVLHDAENIDFLTESSYFKKKYPKWLKTKTKEKDEDKNKVKGKVNQEYIRLYDKYIKTAQHRKGSSFDEDVQEHPYAGGTLNIQEAMRNPLNKLAEDILKNPLAVAPVPVDIFDPVREEITRLVKQNDWFNFLRSRVQNTVTRPCPSADCSCAKGKSFRPYLGCEPHSGRRSMTPPARPSPTSPTRSPLPSPVSSKGSPSMLSPKSRVTPLSPNHGVEFAHVLPN